MSTTEKYSLRDSLKEGATLINDEVEASSNVNKRNESPESDATLLITAALLHTLLALIDNSHSFFSPKL